MRFLLCSAASSPNRTGNLALHCCKVMLCLQPRFCRVYQISQTAVLCLPCLHSAGTCSISACLASRRISGCDEFERARNGLNNDHCRLLAAGTYSIPSESCAMMAEKASTCLRVFRQRESSKARCSWRLISQRRALCPSARRGKETLVNIKHRLQDLAKKCSLKFGHPDVDETSAALRHTLQGMRW